MSMSVAVTFTLVGTATLLFGALLSFAIVSLREGERRAARVAFLAALLAPLPLVSALLLPPAGRSIAAGSLAVFLLGSAIAFSLPVGGQTTGNGRPIIRFDERDVIFARARLRSDSPDYRAYYAVHPERRVGDDRSRAMPGLLSPAAEFAEPLEFAAAAGSFAVTEALRESVDGPVADTRVERPPGDWTALIKRVGHRWGALEVGVCELRPYHVYTNVGRGSGLWGEPIALDHHFAIAFTVEMSHEVMARAPSAPVVAESARQYVAAGVAAVQLATFIRHLGYPARAHIDGNYRVIAPFVARDAGLGEAGRTGILMTPKLGPRVRLGVVTTDLPLVPDHPGDDHSVIDFCILCRKCATNCPTAAIPTGAREEIPGGLRWRIDAESCFRYWCAVGTDCGSCMAVCPYSYPDTALHTVVRQASRRSRAARRFFLWADDIFYGRHPNSRRGGLP